MTAIPPLDPNEPPPHQRGRSRSVGAQEVVQVDEPAVRVVAAEGYPGAVSDFALAAALPAFERAGVDLSECGAPGVLRYTGRGPLGVDQSPPPCVEICCRTSRFGIDSCSVVDTKATRPRHP